MRSLANERDQVALDADGAADRRREAGAVEEHRALLDVQLEICEGAVQPAGGGGRAVKVDAARGEAVGQRDATGVLQPANVVSGQIACAGRGPDQASPEPRALLIGPIDEADPDRRRDAGAAELAHRLERGQQSERTVEPTAIRDRIDVRADDQELVALAGDRSPEVAGLVSLRLEPGLARASR